MLTRIHDITFSVWRNIRRNESLQRQMGKPLSSLTSAHPGSREAFGKKVWIWIVNQTMPRWFYGSPYRQEHVFLKKSIQGCHIFILIEVSNCLCFFQIYIQSCLKGHLTVNNASFKSNLLWHFGNSYLSFFLTFITKMERTIFVPLITG